MEASRPPLKRNRNKGNIQLSKKYQHLNWPNALTKNEGSNDFETQQSGLSGIFIIYVLRIVFWIENSDFFLFETWNVSLMNGKVTKINEDKFQGQIQNRVLGQDIQGQLVSGQETLVLPVDTNVLNADLSSLIKQNPNAKVYVVVPRQVNNQTNKETIN